MRSQFDRRIVPDEVLEVIRALQEVVACPVGGGAALSGAHLGHRLSRDVDVICRRAEDVRSVVRELPEIARKTSSTIDLVRDAGTFIRANVVTSSHQLELDVVYESTPPIEEGQTLEGITVESFADLRASKVTCILSRSEPRDLVDLLFLDRAGFHPEEDLPLALRKDGGVDPGVLAWLLRQFPVQPLPMMLLPLTHEDLVAFRQELSERFRLIALGA